MIIGKMPEGSISTEDAIARFVLRELEGCNSVLDAGCGEGKFVMRLQMARPGNLVIWALEAHEPSLREVEAHRKILALMPDDLPTLPDDAVDAVIAIDVLEHMTMADGAWALREFKRIARRKVVIFTPRGFMEHAGVDHNPLMRHLSGWGEAALEVHDFATEVWRDFDYALGTPHDALWGVWSRL